MCVEKPLLHCIYSSTECIQHVASNSIDFIFVFVSVPNPLSPCCTCCSAPVLYTVLLNLEHLFSHIKFQSFSFSMLLFHPHTRLTFAFKLTCYIGFSILNFNALLVEGSFFKAALWLNLPFTWIVVYIHYFSHCLPLL